MSLVTRTIEVEVPSYYRKHGMVIAITDEAVIKVGKDPMFYYFVPSNDSKRYSEGVVDALRYNPEIIDKQEFETHLDSTIKCLTEQYQLSINMVLDPNTQAAEGQQQEQTAEVAETTQATDSAEATEE